MLSNSSKYAIKGVLFLALNSSQNKKIMMKDMARPINVPKPYIAKLMQQLAKENIVSSKRGPNGGFYLNDKNMQGTIMEIIQVIDGDKKLSSCMLSLDMCNEDRPCPLHNILNSSRDKILKSLNDKTISDLVRDVKSGKSFLPL